MLSAAAAASPMTSAHQTSTVHHTHHHSITTHSHKDKTSWYQVFFNWSMCPVIFMDTR